MNRDRPTRTLLSVDAYVEGVLSGSRAVLARAITLIESTNPEHERMGQEVLTRVLAHTGNAQRIGISGVPGAGKSTFIDAFGVHLTGLGHRVAVLAVDPSSRVSGGSILGDKTRMQRLAADPNAFIRPSPSAGSLGGVARKTREAALLCEAAGFDVVIVETVGVGQSETTVAEMVDFYLVLMLPNAGDELQGIKKGILELADLIAVNKADGENVEAARRAARQYEAALRYVRPMHPGWKVPVLTCSALEGKGLDRIWAKIREHAEILERSGERQRRRDRQLLSWTWGLVEEALLGALRAAPGMEERIARLERAILERRTTPFLAAQEILDAFLRREG
ncbi:MAG TPA: methylmalonyl Co-A mutase-associated GTPase MeaB [Fredinandcohnia sp.]|nr:methylmalonyl Co-A mutase-associated GTPase MeaB [Fredinandcohnia sp.]